jgi:hypothetical protein
MSEKYYNGYRFSNSELIKEFRDYKLKIINGDIDFKVSKSGSRLVSDQLNFMRSDFSNDVLTGSVALILFGLLKRYPSDIDVLIKDSDRYPHYIKGNSYSDINEMDTKNRLGYRNFYYKNGIFSGKREYVVDFFEDIGNSFIEVEIGSFFSKKVIKVDNPINILSYKMKMAIDNNSEKHGVDLTKIFVSGRI